MTEKERTYATWMHLSGLTSYIGIPVGHILVPLVLWLLKRKESVYLDQQGREILNFQLTITFYLIFSYLLVYILIGFLLLGIVVLLHIVATIIAAVRTYDGQMFRYPVTLRVIK
ncbi:MAG: DUF4870 domain-containing protein [Gammaproteobacteria bacterium]|nr:MAG: DUF4870 domain-containing protein [Gammaproteobacteria bacterium]